MPATTTLLAQRPGPEQQRLAPAGTYNLTGAGGTGVGSFNTSITLGPPLTLNNPPHCPHHHEKCGIDAQLDGRQCVGCSRDHRRCRYLHRHGASEVTDVTEFICKTTAGQKTFTVPASILTQLPTITAAQVAASTATGLVEVVSGPPAISFSPT